MIQMIQFTIYNLSHAETSQDNNIVVIWKYYVIQYKMYKII